jgi:hypothetical protein
MKEDVYQKYGPDEDVEQREKAMETAMPSAEQIWEKFTRLQESVNSKHPDAPSAKHPVNLDLRAVRAARKIWQKMRNPYIAIDDLSHPNNWSKLDLIMIAGAIQSEVDIPLTK